MKRIYNIVLAFAALTLAAVSCAPEEVKHEAGQPDVDGCYGVFFPKQDATGDKVFAPTDPTVATFKVGRTVSDGEITVPVVVEATRGENDEEIFEIEDIVFADGQAETTFDVNFPNAKEGTQYSLKISVVDPAYVSTYTSAATSMDFSVLRVVYQYLMNEAGTEKTKVTFTQKWWGEVHTAYIKFYEVDGARYCTTESDPYFYDSEPTTPCYGFWSTGEAQGEGEISFVWYTPDFEYTPADDSEVGDYGADVVKGKNGGYKVLRTMEDGSQFQGLQMEPCHLYNYQGNASNPVYALDYYHYWMACGYTEAELGTWFWSYLTNDGCPITGGYPLCYYDGHGGFYFNFKYFIPSLNGGFSADAYDVVGIAEGYTRVDYSLEAKAGYTDKGAVPVSFIAGADVANIAYEVYEGTLTANQAKGKANEIAADSNAKKVDMEKKGLSISLEASGTYTLVAISLDKDGKYTEKFAYLTFEYATAEDDEAKAVELLVGTEDVSSRYASKGFDTTNSFGAYFCGTGVTELHYAVVLSSKFKDAATSYYALVKSGVKGVTVLNSDAAMTALNTASGISDVFSGLSELTAYTVVVWATNGVKELYTTAEYTTTGIPADWKEVSKGTFVYGTGSFFCDYDKEKKENIPAYDPNLTLYNDANHTDRYKIGSAYIGIDFKFSVNEDGTIVVPNTFSGYHYSKYDCDINIVDMTLMYSEDNLNYYDDSFENYGGSHFDVAKNYIEFDVAYWSDLTAYGYPVYDWCYGSDYFVLDEGWDDFIKWFAPEEEGEDKDAGITIDDWTTEESGNFNIDDWTVETNPNVNIGDWTVEEAGLNNPYIVPATGLDNHHEISVAKCAIKDIDARNVKVKGASKKKNIGELSFGFGR